MGVEDYDAIQRTLKAATRGEFLPEVPQLTERKQLLSLLKRELANPDFRHDVDILAARYWIPEEGLWLSAANKFDAGPAFSPCNERPVRYTLRVCHLARTVLGEVKLDQVFPLGGDIMSHRYHVCPKPSEFFITPLHGASGG